MTQIKIKTPPPRRKSWLGRLFPWLLLLLLLGGGAYFFLSSNYCLQRLVLPRVSEALQMEVTVAEAKLSPFRLLHLRELKVQPRRGDPLLAVQEIRVRYRLTALLRGRIEVTEVLLAEPVIAVTERADGTSNLDPMLKSSAAAPSTAPTAPRGTTPPVQIKSVQIQNATLRWTKHHPGGERETAEIAGLNFTLRDVQNGQRGRMDVALQLACARRPVAAAADELRAHLAGGFDFELNADLQPAALNGKLEFAITNATGALADLAQLQARLHCEVTPAEIKDVALQFRKDTLELGGVRVSGPFVVATREGKFKLELLTLDRRVLNLLGATAGLDFGSTTLNAFAEVESTRAGGQLAVAGRLDLAQLQLNRQAQNSPTVDLRGDYAFAVDPAATRAVVQFLNFSGLQNGQRFLQSSLTSPLTIGWGATNAPQADAAWQLELHDWKLSEWQPLLGRTAPGGVVNGKLIVQTRAHSQQLELTCDTTVAQLSLAGGAGQPGDTLQFQAQAQARQLQQFQFNSQLDLKQQGGRAFHLQATGTGDRPANTATVKLNGEADPGRLAQLAPASGAQFTDGKLNFTAQFQHQAQTQTAIAQLTLTNLTGQMARQTFDRYGVAVTLDASVRTNLAELTQLATVLTAAGRPGGRLDLAGKFKLSEAGPEGDLVLRLAGINEAALRPFVAAALGEQKLTSVVIHSSANLAVGKASNFAVKAGGQVTNLVITPPGNRPAPAPLGAEVKLDAEIANQVAHLRQLQVQLTPTPRATNQLSVTGTANLQQPDALTGQLEVQAEALDLTAYYNLGAGPTPTTPQPKTTPGPQFEPPARDLPVEQFDLSLAIGRLYLRELEITNWQTRLNLTGNQVQITPCQLALNGAPVQLSATADLGVPGYRYELQLEAPGVPLPPLINTFRPELFGQVGGQITTTVQLQGAGVTGLSLQTNLVGQFQVLATNLNLAVTHVRSPVLTTILNVVVSLPELIRNPTALLTRSLSGATEGWAAEVVAEPIQTLTLTGRAGDGKIELQPAQVQSAAFHIHSAGVIAIAPRLEDSTLRLPVNLALGRRYAEKIGLATTHLPTNIFYVPLADFLTVKHTLAEPKTDLSKTGLAALLAQTSGGLLKELGEATGEKGQAVLDVVGGLLAPKTSTNAPTATNTPTGSLLDLLKRPKK